MKPKCVRFHASHVGGNYEAIVLKAREMHLAGATVTGIADGNVIPPTVVPANGIVTLPEAATSATVGLGYQAQLQSLYLDVGQPTVQGQRKKIGDVVDDSR